MLIPGIANPIHWERSVLIPGIANPIHWWRCKATVSCHFDKPWAALKNLIGRNIRLEEKPEGFSRA